MYSGSGVRARRTGRLQPLLRAFPETRRERANEQGREVVYLSVPQGRNTNTSAPIGKKLSNNNYRAILTRYVLLTTRAGSNIQRGCCTCARRENPAAERSG